MIVNTYVELSDSERVYVYSKNDVCMNYIGYLGILHTYIYICDCFISNCIYVYICIKVWGPLQT
jgi:hypothetical protein